MSKQPRIELGAFPAGTIPDPLTHTFLQYDGTIYNIDGYQTLGFHGNGPTGATFTGTTTITDNTVTYTWGQEDMAIPGTYQATIWVQDAADPTIRLGSDLFTWTVTPGIEETS